MNSKKTILLILFIIIVLVLLILLLKLRQCSVDHDKRPTTDSVLTEDPIIDNEFIIKFREGASAQLVQQTIESLRESATIQSCDCSTTMILVSPNTSPGDTLTPQEVRKALEDNIPQEGRHGRIGNVYHNLRINLPLQKKDTGLWFLQFREPTSAPSTLPDKKIIVSVIDGGIMWNAPEFRERMWINPESGRCGGSNDHGFDYTLQYPDRNTNWIVGHGTFVASIIAKSFPADIQLQIMDLRIFDADGRSSLFDALCATHFAVDHGAQVINMSWGYNGAAADSLFLEAVQKASRRDVVIVTSAGNEGQNNDSKLHFPSGFSEHVHRLQGVVSVAALHESENRLADYSNYGRNSVNIAAPGTDAMNIMGASYRIEGTSFAAPKVARAIAIIKGTNPHHDPVDCVFSHADSLSGVVPLTTNGKLNETSAINACR